jgi:hypothetical protein
MGRAHRHGKPPKRPSRAAVVASGGLVGVVVAMVMQPWSGIAAGGHRQVSEAQFRSAASRACVVDYKRASVAAKRADHKSGALVTLSIDTLQQIERDVSAQPHPASLDAALARVRAASGELVSYMQDNRDSIASNRWSPATESAVAPLTDVRSAYLRLGLTRCVSPAAVTGHAQKR